MYAIPLVLPEPYWTAKVSPVAFEVAETLYVLFAWKKVQYGTWRRMIQYSRLLTPTLNKHRMIYVRSVGRKEFTECNGTYPN